MKKTQSASNKEAGIVTFSISETNERVLNALLKYLQRSEYLLKPEETITIDGVINDALECAFSSKIKNLTKKHGFSSELECIDLLNACKDGKEVCRIVAESETIEMQKDYEKILSQIPMPDNQKDLPL